MVSWFLSLTFCPVHAQTTKTHPTCQLVSRPRRPHLRVYPFMSTGISQGIKAILSSDCNWWLYHGTKDFPSGLKTERALADCLCCGFKILLTSSIPETKEKLPTLATDFIYIMTIVRILTIYQLVFKRKIGRWDQLLKVLWRISMDLAGIPEAHTWEKTLDPSNDNDVT